jgi:DNA helicase HerA-like ATPase
MSTLSEYHAGLAVGVVESVAPDTINVVLSPDAPHGTALNTRTLSRFPRINGYVVIPSEAGAVLGLVTWLGVEQDRNRLQASDGDLVGLSMPRRRMRVLPLGTVDLPGHGVPTLERGVLHFPTVGDPVLLATGEQLAALALPDDDAHVRLGTAPLAGGGVVRVDPDRMLGRHLAILGNTGSGKSCSAALFLRRVIEASRTAEASGPRVVVLDANGEYQHAFKDLEGVRVRRFAVEPDEDAELLRVPAWLWNSREWVAFSGAQRAAQAPYLRQALRLLRRGGALADPERSRMATVCRSLYVQSRRRAVQVSTVADFRQRMDAGRFLAFIRGTCQTCAETEPGSQLASLAGAVVTECDSITTTFLKGEYWDPIGLDRWERIAELVNELLAEVEGAVGVDDVHEDDPLFFFVDDLAEAIELASLEDDSGSAVQWMAPLTFRLRHVLNDRRLRSIAGSDLEEGLADLLDSYLAANQVTVIDLSLVPASARTVIVAVLARFLFDAHERYRRVHGSPLSTVLVMEEAHSFIARSRSRADDDGPASATELCRETFERIAREGRKFGLSLVITSQRPAELSETVLSQCNTFLVHRVVNDVDQALLRRLVPDALGELLNELPSLPARVAVLLGWASQIPTLVTIDELSPAHRPQSEDPRFLGVWRSANSGPGWADVADQWTRDATQEGEASVHQKADEGAVDSDDEDPF